MNTFVSIKTGGVDLALATHSVLTRIADRVGGLAVLTSMCPEVLTVSRSKTTVGPSSLEQVGTAFQLAGPKILLQQLRIVRHVINR